MTDIDRLGRSQLHYAALEDDVVNIKKLIVQGDDINLKDRQGFTPLHLAAQEYSLHAAELLLQLGADVDIPNIYGNTPLFVAVFQSHGRGDIIKLLLSYGADPYKVNNHNQTSIGLARLIANYNISQFFEDLA